MSLSDFDFNALWKNSNPKNNNCDFYTSESKLVLIFVLTCGTPISSMYLYFDNSALFGTFYSRVCRAYNSTRCKLKLCLLGVQRLVGSGIARSEKYNISHTEPRVALENQFNIRLKLLTGI